MTSDEIVQDKRLFTLYQIIQECEFQNLPIYVITDDKEKTYSKLLEIAEFLGYKTQEIIENKKFQVEKMNIEIFLFKEKITRNKYLRFDIKWDLGVN